MARPADSVKPKPLYAGRIIPSVLPNEWDSAGGFHALHPPELRRTGVEGLLRRTGTLPVLSFGVPGGMLDVIRMDFQGVYEGRPGFGSGLGC